MKWKRSKKKVKEGMLAWNENIYHHHDTQEGSEERKKERKKEIFVFYNVTTIQIKIIII